MNEENIDSEIHPFAAPWRWDPDFADIASQSVSGGAEMYFQQYYNWNGYTTHTTLLNSWYGFEAEVNIETTNSAYQSGTRGAGSLCPSGYKDQPYAKNYSGIFWAAFVNTGSGMGAMASSVEAYADYNDLLDACNRNSMAVGIRSPQNIPSHSSGMQEIMLTILAHRGVDTSGPISGTMQTIEEDMCVYWGWTGPSNTDCMGVMQQSVGERPTLGDWRGWWAPNKCWTSNGYGGSGYPPATYTC